MRALVAAGERAARSWACVGCDARGAGGGVALVGFIDVAEDCGGRAEAVREGAMVACVCARLSVFCPPWRPAERVARGVRCSLAWIRASLGVYLFSFPAPASCLVPRLISCVVLR